MLSVSGMIDTEHAPAKSLRKENVDNLPQMYGADINLNQLYIVPRCTCTVPKFLETLSNFANDKVLSSITCRK